MEDVRPLLQLSGATVRFGADAAIDDVAFRMFAGEVHSLMGENGAGKSTLIKAITGAIPLDQGVLTLDGQVMRFADPARCAARGHQHGLPGDRSSAEPHRRREHLPGPRAAPIRKDRLEGHPRACTRRARRARTRYRSRVDPRNSLPRRAAARRDRAGDLGRRARARARRTDLESRCRRGGRTVPGHAGPDPARCRDPFRLALPRAGLRDLRPHHRAARRPTRR